MQLDSRECCGSCAHALKTDTLMHLEPCSGPGARRLPRPCLQALKLHLVSVSHQAGAGLPCAQAHDLTGLGMRLDQLGPLPPAAAAQR